MMAPDALVEKNADVLPADVTKLPPDIIEPGGVAVWFNDGIEVAAALPEVAFDADVAADRTSSELPVPVWTGGMIPLSRVVFAVKVCLEIVCWPPPEIAVPGPPVELDDVLIV